MMIDTRLGRFYWMLLWGGIGLIGQAVTAAPPGPPPASGGVALPASTPLSEIRLPRRDWDNSANYYSKVRVGDAVEYQSGATPDFVVRRQVVGVGPRTYTEINVSIHRGIELPAIAIKYVFDDPAPEAVAPADTNAAKPELKISTVRILVGDRELDAELHEVITEGRVVQKTWTSSDVPLGGLIRSEGPDGRVWLALKKFTRGR